MRMDWFEVAVPIAAPEQPTPLDEGVQAAPATAEAGSSDGSDGGDGGDSRSGSRGGGSRGSRGGGSGVGRDDDEVDEDEEDVQYTLDFGAVADERKKVSLLVGPIDCPLPFAFYEHLSTLSG